MIYSLFPSRDATIYENLNAVNTGIDEILEITKIVSSSNLPGVFNTRILIDFDTTELQSDIAADRISNDAKYFLKLFNSSQEQIPNNYILSAAPISNSWDMGIGKSTYTPYVKEGVSWIYRDGITVGTEWDTPGCTTVTESGYVVTQSFNNDTYDVNMDVTTIINSFFTEGALNYQNNGILIQRSGSQETDAKRYGSLKYFSKETHTIYPPRLEVKWDDSSFTTGSLTALTKDEIGVFITNLQSEYNENSRARIKILGRELYPSKTYATTANAITPDYLPSSSYYSIIDVATNETIVPFDTSYTKISCNSSGNYFDFWMNSLLPERMYQVKVRVDNRQHFGEQEYFTCKNLFKVVR